ncbi:uncharacterized protein LOC143029827 isoform X2 [Oratosquilla oratoria]|uniref:uncharacterized protein LOC143029827 isoform X2 n=1 Tax=Oratosquilla oratoria TaxID=337810 RepID=UPI003F75E88B
MFAIYANDMDEGEECYMSFTDDAKLLKLQLWLQACRRQDLMKVTATHAYSNLRLCSKHFNDSCFMNINQRNSLVWDAVPSLFDAHNPPARSSPPLPKKKRLYKNQHNPKVSGIFLLHKDKRKEITGNKNRIEKGKRKAKRIMSTEKTRLQLEAKICKHVAVAKPKLLPDPELKEVEVVESDLLSMKEELHHFNSSIPAELQQDCGEWEFLEIKEEPIVIKTELPDFVFVDEKLPAKAPEL